MENEELLEKRRKIGKTNLLIGVAIVLVVVLFTCFMGWVIMKEEPETIQGEVEVTELRVSGKLAGRVAEIRVEEGMHVEKGDTLAIINTPEIYAKLEQAQAAKAAAEAQSMKAKKGVRAEQIEGAYEMWQKAKVGLSVMEKSYNRIKRLYEDQVVSAQKYDEVEAQYLAAVATEKAAKTQYDMARNGAQVEDKMAAQALVDRAEGAISEVKAYMPEMYLLAPISGEVSEIFPKVGELVGQGAPILNIANLDDSWASINVREDYLGFFKMGKEIEATVPALDNQKIKLKITYIKALGTYATWRATKVSGDFDVRTFEVRAKPIQKVEGLRPGMSVLIDEVKVKE